jgi:hypothetical protein
MGRFRAAAAIARARAGSAGTTAAGGAGRTAARSKDSAEKLFMGESSLLLYSIITAFLVLDPFS